MGAKEMQQTLTDCIKLGVDAVKLEDAGRNYDAYRKYLYTCQKILAELTKEINVMIPANDHIRLKLAKLANQCTERIFTYCQKPDVRAPSASPRPSSMTGQPPPSSPRPNSSPGGPVSPGGAAAADLSDPVELAKRNNQILLDAYKTRLSRANPSARTNMVLGLQKRMIENLEIAKRKKSILDQQLLERQKQLKIEAEERVAAIETTDRSKEQLYRGLLTEILLHDDQHRVLEITNRRRLLRDNGQLNTEQAAVFCKLILATKSHPISKQIEECDSDILKKITPYQQQYNDLISKYVAVPYMCESELTNVSASEADLQALQEEVESDEDNTEVEENIDTTRKKIEKAMSLTDQEINKFDSKAVKPLSREDSVDEMDSLFDSDEEERGSPEETEPESSQTEPSATVTMDEIELYYEAMDRELKHLVSLIHECIYRVKRMFILAYTELDDELGYDVIYSTVEEAVFTGLNRSLTIMFRLANLKKERQMARKMTSLMDADLSALLVKQKWYLGTQHGECYDLLIERLKHLDKVISPLQKMQCTVGVHREIVGLSATYYNQRGTSEPMGADDILPIICYLVSKTKRPDIVSECHLMEMFIPPEYLMEEEGYCLSTFQAAVEYLTTC